MKKVARFKAPRVNEDAIQRGIAQLLERAAPRKVLWWHTPNGEKRDAVTASKLKAYGVKPGVPDFLLLDTSTGYLYCIEAKAKDGYLSDAQKGWKTRFDASPTGRYAVARSVDDAVQILTEWWPKDCRITAYVPPASGVGLIQVDVQG